MAEDMNVMAVDTDEGVSITNRGTAFLGKVQAGLAEAEFTKVKVGTGLRPEETDPMEMTQLVNYKMDALIKEVGYDEDSNDSFVTLQLKNTSITENFVLTEAGIYVNDPDIGEILYGYIDFQNKPIPVIAGTQGVESFECKLHVYTSNVQTFTAILSPLSDVSRQEFDTEINGLKNPVFDDSGEVENITNFSSFLSTLVSGMSIFQFFRNLKAGLKFVMDVGMTVNNLESDSPTLPLSAAQGKALKGMFDQLNAENTYKPIEVIINSELCTLGTAYSESGSIYISIIFKPGYSGNKVIGSVQSNCYPRSYALAQSFVSSGSDFDKFIGALISPTGEISAWVNETLIEKVTATFIYPLKRS